MSEKRLFTHARRRERVAFYQTRAWALKRQRALSENPLCELCLKKTPKKLSRGKIVDHIDPTWTDWRGFLTGKTQVLCKPCDDAKRKNEDIPKLIKADKMRLEYF